MVIFMIKKIKNIVGTGFIAKKNLNQEKKFS